MFYFIANHKTIILQNINLIITKQKILKCKVIETGDVNEE
jgi:hypothetical protein